MFVFLHLDSFSENKNPDKSRCSKFDQTFLWTKIIKLQFKTTTKKINIIENVVKTAVILFKNY